MLINFKKILAPSWKKIALTITLFFIITFLSAILGLSTVGSNLNKTYNYIVFIILTIINPGTFLTPFLLLLLPRNIDPKGYIFIIFYALRPIIQIVYLYVIISIILYLKDRNKKVEMKTQDQGEISKNIVDYPSKNNFKTILKPTLIILAILVVGYMSLSFYADSENKRVQEHSEKALQKLQQTGDITNWKTFTSERGRYQVRYPDWWEVDGSSERDYALTDRLEDTFSNYAEPKNNSIVIEHCHGLGYCKLNMQRSQYLLNMGEKTNIIVGGLPATKGYEKYISRGNTTIITPMVIGIEPYNNTFYQFRLNGDLKNEIIFERMVSTFQFIQ